jgi:hypothetical protein
MDVFVECMVERKVTNKQRALQTVWTALCIITGVGGAMFLIFIPIFLICLFVTISLNNKMKALYEYTYMNGEITFTRLTTNRRKKLFTCNMEQVDEICHYKEFRAPGKGFAATKDFASGVPSDALYVMVVNGEKGKTRVYFEPNTEMLDAMWRSAPRIVKK